MNATWGTYCRKDWPQWIKFNCLYIWALLNNPIWQKICNSTQFGLSHVTSDSTHHGTLSPIQKNFLPLPIGNKKGSEMTVGTRLLYFPVWCRITCHSLCGCGDCIISCVIFGTRSLIQIRIMSRLKYNLLCQPQKSRHSMRVPLLQEWTDINGLPIK